MNLSKYQMAMVFVFLTSLFTASISAAERDFDSVADRIVNYSLKVQPGESVLVTGTPAEIDLLKALVDESPKVARYREDRVQTLWAIADVLWTPDNPAACASLEAALEQVKALIQQFPENPRYRRQSEIIEGRLRAAKSQRQVNLRKSR